MAKSKTSTTKVSKTPVVIPDSALPPFDDGGLAQFNNSLGVPAPPSGKFSDGGLAELNNSLYNRRLEAEQALAPKPPTSQQLEQAYAPYADPNAQYEVYQPDSPIPQKYSLLELIQNQDIKNHVIPVFDPSGERKGIAVKDLNKVIQAGWKLENAEQAGIRRHLEDNKGIVGGFKVAARGFGDELFFGVPDTIAHYKQDPYENAKDEALKEAFPVTNFVSRGAGIVGNLVATEGAGALRFITGAGQLAERGALKLAGRELLSEAAKREALNEAVKLSFGQAVKESLIKAGATGARFGVEGAAFATPRALTEAYFGDYKAAAETLGMNLLGGAVLGGGGSLAFSGAKGLKGMLGKGAEVASKGSDIVSDATIKALTIGKSPEVKAAIEKVATPTALEKVGNYEKAIDTYTRNIVKAGDPVFGAVSEIQDAAIINKHSQMAKLVDRENWLQQKEEAAKLWGELSTVVNELDNTAAKGGIEVGLNKLKKWRSDYSKELFDILDNKDSAGLFMLMDDMKRKIGQQAKFGKSMVSIPEGAREMDNLYHSFRDSLEKPIWGQAALAQREYNAAISQSLSMSQKFEDFFTTTYGSERGRPITVFDPGKVKTFLNSINGAEADLKRAAIQDYASGKLAEIEAVEKYYTITPKQKETFDIARKAISHMETSLMKVSNEASETATLKAMIDAENEAALGGSSVATGLRVAGGAVGSWIGGGVGGLVGERIGSAVGEGISFASRPLHTAQQIAALKNTLAKFGNGGVLLAQQAEKAFNDKLDSAIKSLGKITPKGEQGVRDIAAASPARIMSSLLGKPSNKKEDPQKVFTELSVALSNAITGQNTEVKEIKAALAAAGAPKIADEWEKQTNDLKMYLYETMPKDPKPPRPFYKSSWKATNEQLSSWSKRLEIVQDPTKVIDHIKNNTLTKEHVETLQRIYPRSYKAMVDRVVNIAGEGKTYNYNKRQSLAKLLGIDLGPGTKVSSADKKLQHNYQDEKKGKMKGLNNVNQVSDIQRVSG